MEFITKALANKFSNLDSESIEKEWQEIEKEGDDAKEEKVLDILKRTPGFNMIDMINFGEYCRKGFSDVEWDEKTLDEHFVEWLNKIS